MSANRYAGRSKEWLVARLNLVNDAIDRGSQTVAGVEPGVRHEFAEKSEDELRGIAAELLHALHLLDSTNYPDDPFERPNITRARFF